MASFQQINTGLLFEFYFVFPLSFLAGVDRGALKWVTTRCPQGQRLWVPDMVDGFLDHANLPAKANPHSHPITTLESQWRCGLAPFWESELWMHIYPGAPLSPILREPIQLSAKVQDHNIPTASVALHVLLCQWMASRSQTRTWQLSYLCPPLPSWL